MPDTSAGRPIDFLRGIAHGASHAINLMKENRSDEANKHVDAIERFVAAYRNAGGEPKPDIQTHFGLSYANYLVLPRTLLQSMPAEWQTKFVKLLREYDDAFEHVPSAEAYKVSAATEHIVSEMTEAELKRAHITEDWYGGETAQVVMTKQEFAEWRDKHETAEPAYYRDGVELDSQERVLLSAVDPVPHYNRGRTRVEPNLDGAL